MALYCLTFARKGISGMDFLYLKAKNEKQIIEMFEEYEIISIELARRSN